MQPQAHPQAKKKRGVLKNRLVLFDFDGTITKKDTLAEIMIYYHGGLRYKLGLALLSPIIALYILKLIPNWKAKQYLLSWFFKGESAKKFNKVCREFSERRIPKLVRPKALEMIRHYQSTRATIVVVTASAENWVKPWCDRLGIICLATRLEVRHNVITGRIAGKNCHGEEKACRIRNAFPLHEYDEIIAYGDSAGDKQMLELAHQKHYKPFRS